MNEWRAKYLGRGTLSRDGSGFEIEAFFSAYDRPFAQTGWSIAEEFLQCEKVRAWCVR